METKVISLNLTKAEIKKVIARLTTEDVVQLALYGTAEEVTDFVRFANNIQLGIFSKIAGEQQIVQFCKVVGTVQMKIFAKAADEIRLVWFLAELSKSYDKEKALDLYDDPNRFKEVKGILNAFLKYAGDSQFKVFTEKAPNNLVEYFGWHGSKEQVINFCLTARKEQTQAFVKEADEWRIKWFLDELVTLFQENTTKAVSVFKFTWFCQSAGPSQSTVLAQIGNENLVEFFSIHAWHHQVESFSKFAQKYQMRAFSRNATEETLTTFFRNALAEQIEFFSEYAGQLQINEFCKSRVVGDDKMKVFTRHAGEEQIKWFQEFARSDNLKITEKTAVSVKLEIFLKYVGGKRLKWFLQYANDEQRKMVLDESGKVKPKQPEINDIF